MPVGSHVTFADGPAVALGYQFVPNLPAGLSLSLLDAFGDFGVEAPINVGGSRGDQDSTDRFSGSFGTNLATPTELYPSLAISFQNIRRSRPGYPIEKRTVWGTDLKTTGCASQGREHPGRPSEHVPLSMVRLA